MSVHKESLDKVGHTELEIENVSAFNEEYAFEMYHKKVHVWGRLTIWATIILTLALPAYFSFVLGHHPGWDIIIAGYLGYAAAVGIAWVIEPFMYYPILGVTGTYLGFLAGNISNMCLPCASSAQNALGIEPGTRKAEIVSTLAIGAASIVNMIILITVILSGSFIISLLPDSVTNVFEYILPAIFGGVVAQFAIKKPIYAVFALVISFFIVNTSIPSLIDTLTVLVLTITICLIWESKIAKK